MENPGSIKYLQLPFRFNVEKLQSDLTLILGDPWISHYNEQAYEGEWKVISLYSLDGREENIFASQNSDSKLKKTDLLEKCAYLDEVINTFKCDFISVRLLKLAVGGNIKPHRDFRLGYENDNFRLHIPIQTNDDVKFILGGERIRMQEGECWYTNVNHIHSVSNEGESDRIHLVIDCQRNTWSDNLFFSLAPKEDLITDQTGQQLEMYSNMIKELERINEPASFELIKEYTKKIQELKNKEK